MKFYIPEIFQKYCSGGTIQCHPRNKQIIKQFLQFAKLTCIIFSDPVSNWVLYFHILYCKLYKYVPVAGQSQQD